VRHAEEMNLLPLVHRVVGCTLVAIAFPAVAVGQTLTVYRTAPGQAGPDFPGGTIAVIGRAPELLG
jgi:hypothetical protein